MAKSKKTTTSVATADREFVLATAAKLFRKSGYERTTVKQVAEACNMLPGSLHYRYNSKEALLIDMMQLGLMRASEALLSSFDPTDTPAEQLRHGVNAHLRVLVSDSDMVYALLFEWRSLKGDARREIVRLRDRYEQLWAGMLTLLVERKVIRPDVDLVLLRLMGLGALNWVATWFHSDGRYSLEDVGDFVWRIIMDAVIVKK